MRPPQFDVGTRSGATGSENVRVRRKAFKNFHYFMQIMLEADKHSLTSENNLFSESRYQACRIFMQLFSLLLRRTACTFQLHNPTKNMIALSLSLSLYIYI